MDLFNISGSGDWEVTEVGDILCQNFDKDISRRKKHKNKTKNIATCKNGKKKTETGDNLFLLDTSDKDKNVLDGKNRLLKKIKKKLLKQNHSDNQSLLNTLTEENNSEENDFIHKKGIKRKHTSTPNEFKRVLKKTKNKLNGVNNPTQDPQHIIKHGFQEKLESEKTHSKKHKKKKPSRNEEIIKSNHNKEPFKDRSKISYNESDKEISHKDTKINPINFKKRKQQLQKLQEILMEKEQSNYMSSKKEEQGLTLRQKMMRKLKAARFRFLNEQIYTTTSKETEKIFRRDPEAFKAYHEGYKLQVKRWPLNPLDKIIKMLSKMNKTCVIADFGCGEARLATSVEQKVHSFDLVAVNEIVTACDMAHVPLQDSSVDVAVFCLSLMGTNLRDYLKEANRVLKNGGLLKIAEVESRFEDIKAFIKDCEQYGFKKTWMDLSYNLFYFIDFKKETSIKDKKKLPLITLQPCLYKKR